MDSYGYWTESMSNMTATTRPLAHSCHDIPGLDDPYTAGLPATRTSTRPATADPNVPTAGWWP